MSEKKECRKCKEVKDSEEFNRCSRRRDGLQSYCRNCQSEYKTSHYQQNAEANRLYAKTYQKAHIDVYRKRNSDYRKKNPDKIKKWRAGFRSRNPEKIRRWDKRYKQQNKAKLNAKATKRRNEDLQFKIAGNLRTRLNQAIKNNQKVGSAVNDLGCSVEYFISYIEKQFDNNMHWTNWGEVWELDHIFPLAKADLTDRGDFLAVANYRNYRPLQARLNNQKNAAITKGAYDLFNGIKKSLERKMKQDG